MSEIRSTKLLLLQKFVNDKLFKSDPVIDHSTFYLFKDFIMKNVRIDLTKRDEMFS